MTEEVKTEVVVEQKTEEVQDTPQVSDLEQKALQMGWRPRDDFDGSDDDFIDAKEFVRRKPLFDKIEGQSKELKNVRKAVEALKDHYTKVQETEYNRALASLKEAREQAVSDADGAAFNKLDTQIKKVEHEMAQVNQIKNTPIVEDAPQVHPEFAAWQNKNQWYSTTSYMRKWADDYGKDLVSQGFSNPLDVLRKVEEAVRKEFPQKFTNPNKANAPDVDNSSRKTSGKSEKDSVDLTEQERKVMNMLVSTKTMTKDQYIADIKKMRAAEKSK